MSKCVIFPVCLFDRVGPVREIAVWLPLSLSLYGYHREWPSFLPYPSNKTEP